MHLVSIFSNSGDRRFSSAILVLSAKIFDFEPTATQFFTVAHNEHLLPKTGAGAEQISLKVLQLIEDKLNSHSLSFIPKSKWDASIVSIGSAPQVINLTGASTDMIVDELRVTEHGCKNI